MVRVEKLRHPGDDGDLALLGELREPARELLDDALEPQIARGTLRFLARHQGTHDDPFTDQEPGRILHELRTGEMAACREIPFIPYYGSVDATALFVMLLAEYVRWTGDRALAIELWPAT